VAPLSVNQVLEILGDPRSIPALRRYYNPDPAPGSPAFSGRRFESLGRGCAHEDDRNRFTAADLLAVQCLSVTVPIEVALDLLEGDLGQQVSGLLSKIPADIVLGTGDATSFLEDGREANQAWHLLTAQDNVAWVTAGKLLARKRPHLIPVWDHVVRCALGRPNGAWLWLDRLLRVDEAVVLRRLEDLHEQAGLPSEIPLLRVLDVVIWMRHRDSHRPSRCPGLWSQAFIPSRSEEDTAARGEADQPMAEPDGQQRRPGVVQADAAGEFIPGHYCRLCGWPFSPSRGRRTKCESLKACQRRQQLPMHLRGDGCAYDDRVHPEWRDLHS